MFMVSAKTPQIWSVQTGGVLPSGLDAFGAAKGPPVKVRLGFEGETVPLDGVVDAGDAAAPASISTVSSAVVSRFLLIALFISTSLLYQSPRCGSRTHRSHIYILKRRS